MSKDFKCLQSLSKWAIDINSPEVIAVLPRDNFLRLELPLRPLMILRMHC